MNVWLGVFFLIVLISTIVVLIAENRHPVRTLAWLLVLIFLPVVGLVLYFLFGIDKKHRRLISDSELRRLKRHTSELYAEQICENPPSGQRDLVNLLRSANL